MNYAGCKMWFGTVDYSGWIDSPLSGAESTPGGWSDGGGYLGGDGFSYNSWNTHKNYTYSWPSSSSREMAQLMHSYRSGTYGRGKLHWIEPTVYDTNCLAAKWADPSITLDYEGPSLVPGVTARGVRTSSPERLKLPVASAQYNLSNVPPVTPAVVQPVAENLFTNPNLVGDGTYATVAENLFTNPNLVGDGTWAEVRHNYSYNPSMRGSTARWGTTGALATIAPTPEGIQIDVTTATTAALLFQSGNIPAVAGDRWSSSMTITVPAGFPAITLELRTFSYGQNAAIAISGAVTIQPGTSQRLEAPGTFDASATSTGVRSILYGASTIPAGARFVASHSVLEKSSTVGPYFDGSTTPETAIGVDQPEDFRWRWLGTPNESESVMEIERVQGMSPSACVVGVSTWEGRPAVRLIPITTFTNTYARFTMPTGAVRDAGVVVGTVHLKEPQEGTLNAYPRRIWVDSPARFSSLPPNEAGSYPLRLKYDAPVTTPSAVYLFHGGRQGNGDVWWTDIGLFAGNYTGGAFSGDTAPEELEGLVQPEDFRIRWTGAVDNSTSVMEIERVRGLTGSNAIAGVSSWDGKPAIRVVPNGNTVNSAVRFPIPPDARGTGTAMGTLHLTEPLPGALAANSRRIVAWSPGQISSQPPNEAGSYGLRLGFSNMTSGFHLELWNGSGDASDHVWWTDIGLFAGEYSGPAFSGGSGYVVVGGETLETSWSGTPDNSTSVAGRIVATSAPTLDDSNSVFIPIPDGHQINLGAFYSRTGSGGVYVSTVLTGGSATTSLQRLASMDSDSRQLFSHSIQKQQGMAGVRIWIGKTDSSPASVTISAIHARISVAGVTPDGPDYWMGGQGHSGARFSGTPTYITNNGVDGGQVEYAASFRESVN